MHLFLMLAGASTAASLCNSYTKEAVFAREALAQADIAVIGSGNNDADNILFDWNPTTGVHMSFGQIMVNYGSAIGAAQSQSAPHVVLTKEPCTQNAESKYTMMLLDVDYPDPSKRVSRGSYVLWMVSNIVPGVDVLAQLKNKTGAIEVAPYQQPHFPNPDVKYHRFPVMVYRQPANFKNPFNGTRANFVLDNFRVNFEQETAGNYFRQRTPNCDTGNPYGFNQDQKKARDVRLTDRACSIYCNWTGIITGCELY